jgi:hypothetical protein
MFTVNTPILYIYSSVNHVLSSLLKTYLWMNNKKKDNGNPIDTSTVVPEMGVAY